MNTFAERVMFALIGGIFTMLEVAVLYLIGFYGLGIHNYTALMFFILYGMIVFNKAEISLALDRVDDATKTKRE